MSPGVGIICNLIKNENFIMVDQGDAVGIFCLFVFLLSESLQGSPKFNHCSVTVFKSSFTVSMFMRNINYHKAGFFSVVNFSIASPTSSSSFPCH